LDRGADTKGKGKVAAAETRGNEEDETAEGNTAVGPRRAQDRRRWRLAITLPPCPARHAQDCASTEGQMAAGKGD
jgi:hypothetical protein